jgi:hypothetical protein
MVIFAGWVAGGAGLLAGARDSPAPAINKREPAPTMAASKTLAEGNLLALQSDSHRK